MESIPLGKLIDGLDEQRDAVHVAIMPAIVHGQLAPGQHVGFVEDGNFEMVGHSNKTIGIVDPFLKSLVVHGQRFWVLLYPNTITSLRHDWAHPAFDDTLVDAQSPTTSFPDSQVWLAEFAAKVGLTYDQLLTWTGKFVQDGDQVMPNNESYRNLWYEHYDEFWKHYENVVGTKVAEDSRSGLFWCSC